MSEEKESSDLANQEAKKIEEEERAANELKAQEQLARITELESEKLALVQENETS